MAITFSQIYQPLNKYFRLINPAPDRNIIASERLNRKCNRLVSDYLYIGKVSHLPPADKLANCNLILLEDREINPSYYQASSLNMLITENPAEFKKIQKKIRDIFELQIKINNYAYHLLNMCQHGASVEEILNTGYEALSNPMLLLDASFTLIAHSGTQYVQNEPLIETTLKNGYITTNYLDKLMDEEAYHADNQDLFTRENVFSKHRLLTRKIIRNNQLLGYLQLYECNRPITDLDRQHLALLCQFMSIAMIDTSQNLSSHSLIEDFLTTLLENKIQDKTAIEERARLFNLVLYDSMVAITVDCCKINPEKIYLLKKRIQNHFNKQTIVIFDQKIVILLDSKNITDSLSSEKVAYFKFLLEEIHCIAGISLPFSSITGFYKHYRQSLACLEMIQQLDYATRLLKYEDCKTTHMMLYFSDICDLDDLICADLKLLLAQDTDKGSELAETLFFYIRNRQDITATAREMHLHYNTIKYRINQIMEITEIDFDNPRKIYELIISDQAINLIKQINSVSQKSQPLQSTRPKSIAD